MRFIDCPMQEDLRELKESAADKNEELHRRLERMVGDVEQVISDRKLPERPTGEMEEDKLYVSCASPDLSCLSLTALCQLPRKVQIFRRTIRNARNPVPLTPPKQGARNPIPSRTTRTTSQATGCRIEQVASVDPSGIYLFPNRE